jgi:hypothetical protein
MHLVVTIVAIVAIAAVAAQLNPTWFMRPQGASWNPDAVDSVCFDGSGNVRLHLPIDEHSLP